MILDTGAEVSLITTKFLQDLFPDRNLGTTSRSVRNLGGNTVVIRGPIELEVEICNVTLKHPFYFYDQPIFLLGVDLITRAALTIDIASRCVWSKHNLRAHLRQELADATVKPTLHVNAEPFLDEVSPVPLADTPCEPPGEILDPKATDAPLAPSSMVPTTQSCCSTSVRGPCAVVLSATTTHTIDVGIQCESLASAIQVISREGVPSVCLPQVFRFPLVCPPQVPLSSSPDATRSSPQVSSHPPQVSRSRSPETISSPPSVLSCRSQVSSNSPTAVSQSPPLPLTCSSATSTGRPPPVASCVSPSPLSNPLQTVSHSSETLSRSYQTQTFLPGWRSNPMVAMFLEEDDPLWEASQKFIPSFTPSDCEMTAEDVLLAQSLALSAARLEADGFQPYELAYDPDEDSDVELLPDFELQALFD